MHRTQSSVPSKATKASMYLLAVCSKDAVVRLDGTIRQGQGDARVIQLVVPKPSTAPAAVTLSSILSSHLWPRHGSKSTARLTGSPQYQPPHRSRTHPATQLLDGKPHRPLRGRPRWRGRWALALPKHAPVMEGSGSAVLSMPAYLGHVRSMTGGIGLTRRRGVAHLIVDDNVDGATRRIGIQPRQLQCLVAQACSS